MRCTSVHGALTAISEDQLARVCHDSTSPGICYLGANCGNLSTSTEHHLPPRRRRAPVPAAAHNASRLPHSKDSGPSAIQESLSNLHGVNMWSFLMKDRRHKLSNLLRNEQLSPCFDSSSLLQNTLHSSGVGFGVGAGVGAGSHTFCHIVKPFLSFCLLQFL